jgi:hypothetical protein
MSSDEPTLNEVSRSATKPTLQLPHDATVNEILPSLNDLVFRVSLNETLGNAYCLKCIDGHVIPLN